MRIVLDGRDVDRIMSPQTVKDAVRSVLSSQEAIEAPRASLERHDSWLGLMAAAGMGLHAVKIVGVYPGNPTRGLPLVRGVLLALRTDNGDIILEAPAEEATGWRTAGASALALELMGYDGGGILGVIGSGVQARYHLRVLAGLYDLDGVIVYSRNRSRAERLASQYGGVYRPLDYLLSESTVIVAATNSVEPVVKGSLVRPGSFIVSVGAPRPVRELDDTVLERAGCILVDSPIAREESDDAQAPCTVTLRDALQGASVEYGDLRVYKSVGTPLLDLAAVVAILGSLGYRIH